MTTNKPKVLIIDNSVDVTGALKSIVKIASDIKTSFDFVFIIPKKSKGRFWIEQIGFTRIYELPMVELRRNVKAVVFYLPILFINTLRVQRIVIREQIALIHSNDLYNMLPVVMKMMGYTARYICHVRFMPERFPRLLFNAWLNLHLRFSEKIISVSNSLLQRLPTNAKIVCIYNEPPESERYPAIEFAEEKDEFFFLYLANFISGKGQNYAIEAFAQIHEVLPRWKLRFVGSDMGLKKNRLYRHSLEEKSKRLKIARKTEWHEFTNDVELEYKKSDIVLNFSESESFSKTCLEALFYGRPLIATNCGGPAEIIDHDITGILIENKNVTQMAEAMVKVATEKDRGLKMGLTARAIVRNRFNTENTSFKVNRIYEDILSNQTNKIRALIGFIFFSWQIAVSQNNVGFQIPSQVCIGQIVNFQNTSDPGAASWNFCQSLDGSYNSLPNGTIAPSLSGISIIENGGLWFGFAVTRGNELLRLDFGGNPTNSYVVTSLGNPSGLFNAPDGIQIIKSNGKWYGLVTNQSDIVRLVWADLSQAPVASSLNLSSSGKLNAPSQIEIKQDGANYVAVVANAGSNQLTFINFGTSLENAPSTSDMILSPVFSGSINMYGVTIQNVCGQWVGYTSVSDKMYKVNIGSQLFTAIDPSQVQDISADIPVSIGSYVRLKSTVQGGDTYVYFTSYTSGIMSGFVWRAGATNATFKDLTNLTVPDQLYSLEIYNLNNTNGFYIGSFSSGATSNVVTDSPCSANLSQNNSFQPSGIHYSAAGVYSITLAMTFANGTTCGTSHQIVVTGSQAPDINFSSQNICVNNNVNFSSLNQSGGITNYQWSFGDGGSSTAVNPTYVYTGASVYYPSLTVTATNGCQNFAKDTLQIFNQPQSNFNLPSASPFCTNQTYLYTNTSIYDNGSNPSWQWNMNGSNVSATKDLNYLFTSTSAQSVTLTASIPGCSSQSTQNISTLVAGPLVTFTSPATGCDGSTIFFTNTTTDPVSSFSWSLGDGTTSNQPNPTNAYSPGVYTVSLNATNTAGCQNSFTKNISVYSNPQPDFAIEAPPLSCADSPSQFDNLTPSLVDSNVASWGWSFGDASNGLSSNKNPTFTYISAGTYNVSLQATTNFGCAKTIQKAINVSPSPQAGFNFSTACINQTTHFTDHSSGTITFYQWSIQSNVLSGTNPSYVFKSSGNFPVTLTVTGSNGCLSQTTKPVSVPVMPAVDFTVQAPCTGHPSIFQELDPGGADPAVAWNWSFGSDSGTGSPVSYQFANEGGYTVTMNSTRQSGCVYSASKNISISAGPVADFTPSIFAGAAPLSVTFTNTSTADSYLWTFGDLAQTTSTATSPTFVYNSLGAYKAMLTANNNLGCSDTLSTEIDVVIPRIDLVMDNFTLTNDPVTHASNPVVTIFNMGNIPFTNPTVQIDLGNGASIEEKISGMVRPGKSLVQTLSLQIVPNGVEYICAEINVDGDVNDNNNEQCISLSGIDAVMNPYPNPSTAGKVNLDWVGAAQENIHVVIYKSNGDIAFEQTLDAVNSGLGHFVINTSLFPNGLYLIRVDGSKTTKVFRIVIAN